ncbi:MAG: hypothetical protein KDA84_01570 [Planctomycetaceae bacterium]|nr:hypothetical protein [Planctomycetaceae bacterium]
MADRSIQLKQAREIWSQVRAFGLLWLAFTSLGGFIVLVGGPWVLGILTAIFGEAASRPGRVITILMIITLPIVIYVFLQQKRLADSTVACSQCGERYPNTNSSCPMCGCARPSETPS